VTQHFEEATTWRMDPHGKPPPKMKSVGYDMGVVGNGRTCALIDHEGSVVFMCLPDFDSGAIFCDLLSKGNGGKFGISIENGQTLWQRYEHATNILVTRYESEEGGFEVIDFMPRYRLNGEDSEPCNPPDLVRVIRRVWGKPRYRINYNPRLEFAKHETTSHVIGPGRLKSTVEHRYDHSEVYESIYLHTDMDTHAVLNGHTMELHDERFLLLSYNDKLREPTHELIQLMLTKTRAYWFNWALHTVRPPRYHETVVRSALALKLMQFGPSGALIAAATTSLPESIGEVRNWDYRFCWIRDASMTVSVLRRIGHADMAHRFVDWVMDTVPTKDDTLQIMYGIRGERTLEEHTLDHLDGYMGSKPVRTGNAAYHQKQHDIYGAVMDVIWQTLPHFARRFDQVEAVWTQVRSIARAVERQWKDPDRGIWEIRGDKKHFVFSKVLCWVAVDRAVKIGIALGRTGWAEEHRKLADEIKADIETHGWSDEVGAYTQAYGSKHLDASNLLMLDYGFCEPDDPRYIATVEKTRQDLGRDGLLYRYRGEDDFGEPTSAFTICSFWLAKALVRIGRVEEGQDLFEELLDCANHVGLMSEDLAFADRRQLGNFPQAYSHLAIIDTALAINAALGWTEPMDLSETAAY
jgi:GH15 family glucan-1,4-alpha-glucosidase